MKYICLISRIKSMIIIKHDSGDTAWIQYIMLIPDPYYHTDMLDLFQILPFFCKFQYYDACLTHNYICLFQLHLI